MALHSGRFENEFFYSRVVAFSARFLGDACFCFNRVGSIHVDAAICAVAVLLLVYRHFNWHGDVYRR